MRLFKKLRDTVHTMWYQVRWKWFNFIFIRPENPKIYFICPIKRRVFKTYRLQGRLALLYVIYESTGTTGRRMCWCRWREVGATLSYPPVKDGRGAKVGRIFRIYCRMQMNRFDAAFCQALAVWNLSSEIYTRLFRKRNIEAARIAELTHFKVISSDDV